MKAAHLRCAFVFGSMSIFVGILSGCAVSGKSFAIDSNSRIPFFGLELQERKPKNSAPSYRSIAKTTGDTSRVNMALQLVPATPNGASKKWGWYPAAASSSVVSVDGQEPTLVVNPSGHGQPAESLQIPRTDRKSSPFNRQPTRLAVDFQ